MNYSKSNVADAGAKTNWGRVLSRFMEYGKAEWWVYASVLIWLAVAPVAIWGFGQAGAAASALRQTASVAQALPSIQTEPLSKVEMQRISQMLGTSFPGITAVVDEKGFLRISAADHNLYHDWILLISAYLPSVRQKTIWSVVEMCLSADKKCESATAINVKLRAETLSIKGHD